MIHVGGPLRLFCSLIFLGFCVQFHSTDANPQWRNGKLSSEPYDAMPIKPIPSTFTGLTASQFSPDQLNTNKEVISHPWQIPASFNARDPASGHAWNPAVDQFFYRSKRRNNLASNLGVIGGRARMGNRTSDHSDMTGEVNQMAARTRNDPRDPPMKIKSAKLGTKWPSVSIHPYLSRKGNTPGTRNYNPLPYGLPYAKSTDGKQGSSPEDSSPGLPFARRPFTRSKSPAPLRLPIPDSEIHYRKPVNNSILRAYHEIVNEKYGTQAPSADWKFTLENPSSKTTDVESFRVLIDVIKSLMVSSSEKKPPETN